MSDTISNFAPGTTDTARLISPKAQESVNIEQFVKPDGDIRTYHLQDYNLDQINAGKLLFRLYQETGDERYPQAEKLLMKQLKTQPCTSKGGFWHKKNLSSPDVAGRPLHGRPILCGLHSKRAES